MNSNKRGTRYLIGTSGWHYQHWLRTFYPLDLPKQKWLEFYAGTFSTVELNNTFYRQPTEKAVNSWANAVPAGFKFAVKASRFITHIKRLKDASDAMDKFIEVVKPLKNKLGPLLYQLPPSFHRDDRRLLDFLKLLPTDLEHIIEFRHNSWLNGEVYNILRANKVGFCIYDMPEGRTAPVVTAEFAYVRFHGSENLYGGSYTDEELQKWAEEISRLNVIRVYVYFNNDAGGFAITNALTMKKLLGT